MKLLTLIRHAKSSWAEPSLPDFERPLNKRGKRDLPLMAQRISDHLPPADIIIASGAQRARTTAEQVLQLQNEDSFLELVPELYEGCTETVLNTLQNQSDQYKHLMLIGHNPALEMLIQYLSHKRLAKFPTAAVAHMHLNVLSWSEAAESCATLEWLDYPKLHAPYA